tara:strand:+ start:500 stop:727 length:228 start_codon:yes stop_codon:yes gene_type:complete
MTKTIIDLKTNTVSVEELSTEDLTQKETDIANAEAELQAKQNAEQTQADLKASAKAKLMAGEALTEDEANVMIGG